MCFRVWPNQLKLLAKKSRVRAKLQSTLRNQKMKNRPANPRHALSHERMVVLSQHQDRSLNGKFAWKSRDREVMLYLFQKAKVPQVTSQLFY